MVNDVGVVGEVRVSRAADLRDCGEKREEVVVKKKMVVVVKKKSVL